MPNPPSPRELIDYNRVNMGDKEFLKWLKTMLRESASEIFQIEERKSSDNCPDAMLVTEMMAIVGFEWIDEDSGDRAGDVRFIFPYGGIPSWKVDGLLSAAARRVDIQFADGLIDIEEDGD